MKIDLTKDEAEYILRCIDLGETFVQTHQWSYNKNWRNLKIVKESLIDRLKKISNMKKN